MIKINKSTALLICIGITVSVMIIEFIVSYIAQSLMLYSDGLHMLSHGMAMSISLGAVYLSKRKNSYHIEAIAALINGIGLLFFTLIIIIEAIQKIDHPQEILITETMIVAFLGLLINLTTARILWASGVEDINTKSAFLHMLADTISSVSIILGTIIISYTDLFIIDIILSMIIGLVIAKWSIGLIVNSIQLLNNNKRNIIDIQ